MRPLPRRPTLARTQRAVTRTQCAVTRTQRPVTRTQRRSPGPFTARRWQSAALGVARDLPAQRRLSFRRRRCSIAECACRKLPSSLRFWSLPPAFRRAALPRPRRARPSNLSRRARRPPPRPPPRLRQPRRQRRPPRRPRRRPPPRQRLRRRSPKGLSRIRPVPLAWTPSFNGGAREAESYGATRAASTLAAPIAGSAPW
jgi:hypothetical protein